MAILYGLGKISVGCVYVGVGAAAFFFVRCEAGERGGGGTTPVVLNILET